MPTPVTRRSLGLEITVSLAVKVVALLAIGFLLFGPDERIRPNPASAGSAIVGDGG